MLVLPEKVPVVPAEKFVVGPLISGHRMCLIGWRSEVFGCGDHAKKDQNLLGVCCTEAGNTHIMGFCTHDDTLENREKMAEIWLAFIQRKGYNAEGVLIETKTKTPSDPDTDRDRSHIQSDTHCLVGV